MASGSWSMTSETLLNEKYPLHRACRDGDVKNLGLLLQEHSLKEHLTLEDTYYGWTPAHWAAYFGRLDCMRVLNGMNKHGFSSPIDIRTTRFNQTPSHIAAFAGHPQCLQWLLQTGAAPDARDYLGETPLHKAARTGSAECVSLLAAQKAIIGVVSNNGQTPSQLATACGRDSLAAFISNLEAAQEATENTQQQQTKSIISSNGYYGFQPKTTNGQINHTNGQNHTNGHITHTNGSHVPHVPENEDCDMETDSAPVSNGTHNSSSVSNENSLDITLDPAVCHNHKPIGGRKRSREDSPMPQLKRTRIEDYHPFLGEYPIKCNATNGKFESDNLYQQNPLFNGDKLSHNPSTKNCINLSNNFPNGIVNQLSNKIQNDFAHHANLNSDTIRKSDVFNSSNLESDMEPDSTPSLEFKTNVQKNTLIPSDERACSKGSITMKYTRCLVGGHMY